MSSLLSSCRARVAVALPALALALVVPLTARADEPPTPPPPPPPVDATPPEGPPPAPAAPPAPQEAAPDATTAAPPLRPLKLTFSGYVEGYYAFNLNRPSNNLTNYRWIDDRHNTFQLSTVVLDTLAEVSAFSAHVALQLGPTADGWYGESAEARRGAAGAAANGAGTWKYLQQANVGWKAPLGRGLLLQAGLFLTPIGFEGPAVKDNFNWSRSNLFFALPFYHVGIRATYELSDRFTAMLMVVNGWNAATDANGGKSVIAQLTYKVADAVTASALYMGGPERPAGSPEGEPWRHLLDGWVQLDLDPRLSVAVHADAGLEQGRFGT
ncbi:MAG TPA: outer membrane beta-barrel protein, partial [Labilithrix sp.]|nr:outer membrane beta-barrel protein [Labilithrix sp.]